MENIEAAMKRIPPHSTEAEQAVLGAMLMNKDAITVTSEILAGQDFYQTAYGILFDAMTDLFKSGRPVDLITLQEYLKTKDVPPEVSSMEFARDLLVGTQTSANVKYYAEIVKEKSVLRKFKHSLLCSFKQFIKRLVFKITRIRRLFVKFDETA